jgi:membrane fusion protein (multidrug efflux system)
MPLPPRTDPNPFTITFMSQPALAKSLPDAAADLIDSEPPYTAAADRPPRGSSPWRKVLVVALLIAGLAWGARSAHHALTHTETDDAFITSYVHQVNAHVSGTISEVHVEQNTDVKAGDVLFRLDPRDHEAKLQQAEAQFAQSEAVISFTKTQIAGAHAKIDQAQAELTKAQADFTRVEELVRTRVVSKQEFDAAKATLDSASAGLISSKSSALGMESGLQVALAQRQNSQTQLENARLQLSYNTITAPVAGRTSRRNAELGAYVQPGQTLIAIVEPEVWIEANFKETQLAKMRVGQPVEITIDALPGHEFHGKVESFSPASGAQFAMLPPDNATGNFTKVVQRVPVRIRFDADSIRGYEDRLRAGLSAVVAVRVN